MTIRFLCITLLAGSAIACDPTTLSPTEFATEPTMTPIEPRQIDETSGITESRSQPGTLWVEQDSGSPAELALLGHDGKVRGKLAIPNATNRDWEDIASGPGPQAGINYLYIGEIGDNNAQYGEYTVYRLPEPSSVTDTPKSVERIRFKYPDGARDAETLMLDPQTKDLYVVSKREAKVHLYRLPYPQSTTEIMTAELLGELPFDGTQLGTMITSGDISSDGSEILLRSYLFIYYWSRGKGQSIADAMQRTPARELTSRLEPQGEAICFDRENNGFFTLSERASAASVTLNYYKKR